MKENVPYNAGQIAKIGNQNYVICGHIWWPVEQKNAYHLLRTDKDGNPTHDKPEYIWDHGGWEVRDVA